MTESRRQIYNMLRNRNKSDDRDYSHFHPSSIGGCPRATYFQTMSIPGDDDIKDNVLVIFDNGHHTHDRIQKYFKDSELMMTDKIIDIKEEKSLVSFNTKNDGWLFLGFHI